MFSVYFKRQPGVFQFLQIEERFRKAPFSLPVVEKGESNRRNKDALSSSSRVVRTRPKSRITNPMTSHVPLKDTPCTRAYTSLLHVLCS